MHRIAALAAFLALAACTTQTVGVRYDPAAVRPAAPEAAGAVTLGEFVDQRGHGARWLGAIRGGLGNPLKTLETDRTVREVVRDAFRDGLAARGLLAEAEGAPLALQVAIVRYDCNQVARREAHADFDLRLIDRETGRTAYRRRVTVDRVDGTILTLNAGIFGSIEDLRKLANDVLQQAVDQALDDSALRATVAEAAAPPEEAASAPVQ